MDGDKVAVRSVLYGTTGDAPDTAPTMREIFRVTFGAGRRTRPRFRPSAPMERSLSPSGGGLRHFLGTREEMLYRAPDVIEGIKNGSLGPCILKTLPLTEAPQAHRLLDKRQAIDKILLSLDGPSAP